jgi:type III pantothenate kinase
MLLAIDIGNTRTKWAMAGDDGGLQNLQVCLNDDIASSDLKRVLKSAKRVLISNVAGEVIAEQVAQIAPPNLHLEFVTAQPQACGVINRYQQNKTLGADRWAALVAAWHMHKQPTIVVNAGTAITIDALAREHGTKNGVFIGGTIMPGLRLMFEALGNNTAQLKTAHDGAAVTFPINTQDAVQSGCMNAIVGSINLMLQQLEKHCAYLPKLIMSGGDANKVAEALKPYTKRVIIAENLVLQGLVLLAPVLLDLDSQQKELI